MKTCVIIPAYNEAKAIAGVIKQAQEQGFEVVVIDDGSHDDTPGIARDCGATVIRNPGNEGKGASLIKGFKYALNKDFDAVITMDGDGQHSPSDIQYFIRLAKYSDNGILIGNRMSRPKNMPWLRLLTNKFMSCFISRIIGQNIPDTQCGFRLIKKTALEKLNLNATRFEIESELIIKAGRMNIKIESIPIATIYNKEHSQINPIIDTLRFIRFIIGQFCAGRFKKET